MQINETGVRCVTPRWLKWMILVGFLIVGFVVITQVLDNSLLGWAFLFYLLLRMPFYSPDIIVYQSGIKVRRFFYTNFLAWDDIAAVRIGQINAQIYPKGIPFWMRYALFDSLLISKPRTNYDEAIEIIRENRVNVESLMPQRVYEASAK